MHHINAKDIVTQFKGKRILIVGDVMVDSYVWGESNRMSPEAPVPIVSVNKREDRLGGAANVALNIKAFEAEPILCAVVGNDDKGRWLTNRLEALELSTEVIFVDQQRPTTRKTRIISNGEHVLRLDEENCDYISDELSSQLFEKILTLIEGIDAVILQDYNKGVLTEGLISSVIELCNSRHIPTLVDPKKENFLAYKNATCFKPNRKELIEGLGIKYPLNNSANIEQAVRELNDQLHCKQVLVTLSEMGICLLENDKTFMYGAHPRNIVDVSGAGDTVISIAGLCSSIGMEGSLVAQLSNLAGGQVCEKLGVVVVDPEQFTQEIEDYVLTSEQ